MVTLAGGAQFLSFYIVGMLGKSWSPPLFAHQYDWQNGMAATVRAALGNPTCNAWAFDTTNEGDTVEITASKVGTGTAAAFFDVKAGNAASRFIRVNEFARI